MSASFVKIKVVEVKVCRINLSNVSGYIAMLLIKSKDEKRLTLSVGFISLPMMAKSLAKIAKLRGVFKISTTKKTTMSIPGEGCSYAPLTPEERKSFWIKFLQEWAKR